MRVVCARLTMDDDGKFTAYSTKDSLDASRARRRRRRRRCASMARAQSDDGWMMKDICRAIVRYGCECAASRRARDAVRVSRRARATAMGAREMRAMDARAREG